MRASRLVVDISTVAPAFFPEGRDDLFDAGLVTNRATSLVHAIRLNRVKAFVSPSFSREFSNFAVLQLYKRGGRSGEALDHMRAQWQDVRSLPLILEDIVHHSGILALEEQCPPADAWYVAMAVLAHATFWTSHEHRDKLYAVASKHVAVRLLSRGAADC